MAQKWYLLNATNGASGLPTSEQGAGTADVTWPNANTNRTLSGTPTSSQSTVTGTGNSNAQRKHFCQRFVSGPLAAGTYGSGTWTVGIAANCGNASQVPFNAGQINVYFWRPSTQAKVGSSVYDVTGGTTRGGANPSGSGENTTFYTFSGAGVTIQNGDVLCIEIWDTWTGSSTTSRTLTLYFGGTTEPTQDNVSASNCRSFVTAPANIPELSLGSLSVVLNDTTLAGSADAIAEGTLAATLDSATVSGSGTVTNPSAEGTLAVTLVDVLVAASGLVQDASLPPYVRSLAGVHFANAAAVHVIGATSPYGLLDVILAEITVSGSGVVASAPVEGTLDVTLDGSTLAASGTLQEVSPVPWVKSLAGVHFANSAAVHVEGATSPFGNLDLVLSAITLSGSGTVTSEEGEAFGSLNVTLDQIILTGTSEVGIEGTLGSTLAEATLGGVGEVDIEGTLGSTLAGATLAGTGEVDVEGTLDTNLAGVTLAGSGLVVSGRSANLNITLADVIVDGDGEVSIDGDLSVTLASTTVGGQGDVGIEGSLLTTLGNLLLAGTGQVTSPDQTSVPWVKSLAGQHFANAAAVHVLGATSPFGTLNVSLAIVTVVASGTVETPEPPGPIEGDLAVTLAGISLVGAGTVPVTFSFTSPNDYSIASFPQPVQGTATPGSQIRLKTDSDDDLIWPVTTPVGGTWSATVYGSTLDEEGDSMPAHSAVEGLFTAPTGAAAVRADSAGQAGAPPPSRNRTRIVNPDQNVRIYVGRTQTAAEEDTAEVVEPNYGIWEDYLDANCQIWVRSAGGTDVTGRLIQYTMS